MKVMKSRTVWKTATAIGLVAFALNALATDAEGYHVWISSGTGTWNDATRWVGGDIPSSAGSKVRIGGLAPVTDADFAILDNCSEILLDVATASLVFENTVEQHVTSQIIGSGSIVKNGAGDLHLDCTDVDGLRTAKGMIVNVGNLYLPSSTSDRRFGPIAVNKPGTLYVVPTGNTVVEGLSGDGTVLNPGTTARELKFSKGDSGAVKGVFSGTIGAYIDYTMTGGLQDMLLPADDTARSVRLYSGEIGISDPKSLGTSTHWLRGDDNGESITLRYLGTAGGDTGMDIRLASDNKLAILDAGAYGGLNFTGNIRASNSSSKMSRMILDGSNTQACVISGGFMEGDALSTYVTKRGTGTWRFSDSPSLRHCRGVFAVERGVLEFTSIAEAGTRCSLGYQNILHDDYVGTRDDSRQVPYAFLLGNGESSVGSEVGTLSYVGTSAGSCATRPIALKGAGRLRNAASVSLDWSGVTSKAAGDNVLVLAGTGTDNTVRDVTNGVGCVSLVKEDAGTWTVDGNIDVTGRVAVSGGTLELKNRQVYRWFRLNVKETWAPKKGSADTQLFLNGFVLLDVDGNRLTDGFQHDTAADGNPSALAAGEAAMNRTGYTIYSSRVLDNLFKDDTSIFNVGYGVMPVLTDESTWISVVVRLPEDAATVTAYDMCATVGGGTTPHDRNAYSWSLEGSRDGLSWVELDSVISNATETTGTVAKYVNSSWYSSGTSTPSGFGVDGASHALVKMSKVSSVQVSNGGVLHSDEQIASGALRIDCSASAGTISGVRFVEGAVLELTGLRSLGTNGELPVVFGDDVSGVEYLTAAAPVVDGVRKDKYSVVYRDGRLYLRKPGFVIILR